MRRTGPRTAPFVLPFVFGGPPRTRPDREHAAEPDETDADAA